MQNLKKVQICAEILKNSMLQKDTPKIGLVLGTGLGEVGNLLEDATAIAYTALPEFPQSTVSSHAGRFLYGRLADVPVILQQGRCHLYEGRTPAETVMGVRVMAHLGIEKIVLTNSAGALNPIFDTGSLMRITDQINFTGRSPLTGGNDETLGPRFPDMSALYDLQLGACLDDTALSLGFRLEKGVYFGIAGPQLETRAETRAYRTLGGDAVGMSTVLEAIAAHHMGVRVAGLACLSNKNLPDCMEKATIEEILAVSMQAGKQLEALLTAALPELAQA